MKAFDINIEEIEDTIRENILQQLHEFAYLGMFSFEKANNRWQLDNRDIHDLPSFIKFLFELVNNQDTYYPYTYTEYIEKALAVFKRENRTEMTEEEFQDMKNIFSKRHKRRLYY